jgi:outer membrane protein OmpA-like peptidoglycan-associated protein
MRMVLTLGALAAVAACSSPAQRPATPIAVPAMSAAAMTLPPAPERSEVSPPWTLTASDGTGLALVRVDAKAVTEGPLAFTELHLYFKNDEPRVREGTFQIALPPRASVARFAMENDGAWMEAEVVPKMVARRAYDDFLHRRQDPALLEKAAGNQFTAKVFPIAGNAEKHLVISYSEELPGSRYVLPLRGMPKAAQVDVQLAVTAPDGTHTAQQLHERDWQPDHDFMSAPDTSAVAVGAGGLVAAQLELGGGEPAGREAPRGVTLLVDTSASRALGFAAYLAAVRRMIGGLGVVPIQVIAFDQDSQLVFTGRAADYGDAAEKRLLDRGAAGASDLGQALASVTDIQPRVVVVTDGVFTAGADGAALAGKVAALAGERVERLDVVLAGGLRDDRAADRLVHAGLAHTGAVLDLDADPVARLLAEPVWTGVQIDVPGATWSYPRTIASARPGTKVMVYARMPQPVSSIGIVANGVRHDLRVLGGEAPLVERALGAAEVAYLEDQLALAKPAQAGAIRAAISGKSVAARVLSSETAMLVLETDADYARYHIDRKALGDVLVVGAHGVERAHRATATTIAAREQPQSEPATQPQPQPQLPPQPATVASPTGPDNDHDGIPDAVDACPNEPETYNGYQDDDGCPDRGRVVISETSIEILDAVYFDAGSSKIRTVSNPILDAVAATLIGNPDIEVVEVQGHADDPGTDAHNLDLSDKRAAAVMAYLVAKGVAPARLQAAGYGSTQKVDRHTTAAARAKNRRAGFLILRRGGSDGALAPHAPPPPPPPPLTGELAEIEDALAAKHLDAALEHARAWHAREPGNVLALIGLGDALEATHADAAAARTYGSIIDLYPGRADLRRFAGERLARVPGAQALVVDTDRRAVADRPDHLNGHRLLAYALVRAGDLPGAFAAVLAGLDQPYPPGRFLGGLRVLGEDAGMIGAAYAAAVPAKRDEITAALAQRKLALAAGPSTRFILYWETDNNDVDFHITDAHDEHAFYQHKTLKSGGELYADNTTGYGPECFAIDGTPPAAPYRLAINYFAQGPMGYGMGLLEIQTFDPQRGFTFEDRPYVIMRDHAFVDLGSYLP